MLFRAFALRCTRGTFRLRRERRGMDLKPSVKLIQELTPSTSIPKPEILKPPYNESPITNTTLSPKNSTLNLKRPKP